MNTELLGYSDSRTNTRKRIQILSAARSLFFEECVDQTTMYLIAERAGVTRRTVYNYYDSKEKIAVDLQILAMEEMGFHDLWTDSCLNIGEEKLFTFARDLLVTHIDQMNFISCFDFFFSEGYPDSRYIEYLTRKAGERKVALGIPDSDPIEEHPVYGPANFTLHLLTAYIQRLIQKTKGDLDFAAFEDEIRYFIRILVSYSRN